MIAPLLLRVDAGPKVGGGHVMRCLAIAEEWTARGGACELVLPEGASGFRSEVERRGFRCSTVAEARDLESTLERAKAIGAGWIATDGYRFPDGYIAGLRAIARVLVVDDGRHYESYPADAILNPSVAADDLYADSSARLFTGNRFTPIRREFRYAKRALLRDRAETLVVTLGASDPDDTTSAALRAIDRLERRPAVRVILGPGYAHRSALDETLAAIAYRPSIIVAPPDIAGELARADACVVGSGSTTWELAVLGVPMLAVVLAENQEPVARSLVSASAALSAKGTDVRADPSSIVPALTELLENATVRRSLAEGARTMLDGEGAGRIVQELNELPFRLRSVRPEDSDTLLRWANDPVARAVSFSTKSIERDEHERWFASRLADPQTLFFVAVDRDDRPLGYVRLQIESTSAEVSIALDASVRGRGLSAPMLADACRLGFALAPIERIDAYIRPDNEVSVRAFEAAGFAHEGPATRRGSAAERFVRSRA